MAHKRHLSVLHGDDKRYSVFKTTDAMHNEKIISNIFFFLPFFNILTEQSVTQIMEILNWDDKIENELCIFMLVKSKTITICTFVMYSKTLTRKKGRALYDWWKINKDSYYYFSSHPEQ